MAIANIDIEVLEKLDQEQMEHIGEIIKEDEIIRKVNGEPIPDQYGVIIHEGQIRIKKYFFNKEKPAAPKGTTD
ncbi:MAG: hypothetical protein ACOCQA_01690 [bacterium]